MALLETRRFFRALLPAAIALASVLVVSAQTVISPGETGTLLIPVVLDSKSDIPADVRLINSESASINFITNSLSATLQPGDLRYFGFSFSVPGNAAIGPAGITSEFSISPKEIEIPNSDKTQTVTMGIVSLSVRYPDTIPPITTLSFSGPTFSAPGRTIIWTDTRIQLVAADPSASGVAPSGVAAIRYFVDGVFVDTTSTPGVSYSSPFTLPSGRRDLTWYALDSAGNVESPRSVLLAVDGSTPTISNLSPSGSGPYSVAGDSFTVGFTVIDDADPSPSISARLLQVEDRGLPRGARPAFLEVTSGTLVSASSLDDGLWVLVVSATDSAKRSGHVQGGPFEIMAVDSRPPRTQLALGPNSVAGTPAYVSPTTPIAFSAVDDLAVLGDGAGLGVAYSSYSIDSSTTFTRYSSTFTLINAGTHSLVFFSVDLSGNVEEVQVASVAVDATPPAALSVFPASGTFIGRPPHVLAAAFADPDIIAGLPGSGVDAAAWRVLVDDSALSTAAATALGGAISIETSLQEGARLIRFEISDRVANAASTSVLVNVDLSSPTVSFSTAAYYNARLPTLSAVIADPLSGLATASLTITLAGAPIPFTAAFETAGGTPPGPWQTASFLPSSIHLQGFALLNGRLYSVGGHDGAGGPRADVNFNTLAADGVPGTWFPTSSLPAARYDLVAVTALGRLYALGGTGGALANTSLFYAKPESNGTITGWSSAALPTALAGLSAVSFTASGSDLYAIAGFNSSGQTLKSVYVSRLNATTGAPGPWDRLVDMPAARGEAHATQWNGRLYVLGGFETFGSMTSNRVFSAKLGDHVLTDWREERPMPLAVRAPGAVALQGRLYAIGGQDGSGAVRQEVYSAAVLPDGALGTWQPEPSLPTPLAFFGSAASASGIYIAGGYNGSGIVRETRYALGTPGSIVSARLDAVPTTPLNDGQYIFGAAGADRVANAGAGSVSITIDATPPSITLFAGGVQLSSAQTRYISTGTPALMAQFSDAGSGVDPQTALLLLDGATVQAGAYPLAQGRHTLEARVSDNAHNAATLAADFFIDTSPPIVSLSSPSAGAIFGAAPFTLAASFVDTLSGLATDQLFLSVDGVTFPAAITLSGGVWETASALPTPIHFQGFALLDGRLYSVGGHDGAGGPRAEVNFNTLGADGVPGAWNTTSVSLPAARYDLVAVTALGRLYALGGTGPGGGLATSSLFYALPDSNGRIPGWTAASLPTQLSGLSAVSFAAVGADLFAIGGFNSSGQMLKTVWVSSLDAAGAPGTWRPLGDMPLTLGEASATQWNGRVYVLGGMVTDGSTTSKRVYSAKIENHDLIGWREEQMMPLPVRALRAVALQGRIYAIGGLDGSGAVHDKVYSAAVASDGRLGAWQPEAGLPAAMAAFGAAASASGIYVAGGYTGSAIVANTRYILNPGRALATVSATAVGLLEGPHEARATAADLAGNTAFSSAAFFVDLTAPRTELLIAASSRTLGGTVYVLGVATVSFTATDGPAGVFGAAGPAGTFLSVDGATVSLSAGYAAPAAGLHLLSYHSIDAVGNVEVAASSSVKFDAAPPAAVSDLRMLALSTATVRLNWTSPGDDGLAGDIADGAVRLVLGLDPNFALAFADAVVVASGTLSVGRSLAALRAGLSAQTTYYAALFTRDTAGNWSAASNTAAARTFALAVSSDGVVTLAAPGVPAAVSVIAPQEASAGAFSVATDAGLTSAAASYYDLTDGLVFPPEAPALLSFQFNPTLVDTATVAIYTFDGVAWTSAAIANQRVVLLAADLAEISGEILHTSLYAPMVRDTRPPLTTFSLAGPGSTLLEGRRFGTEASSAVLTAQDRAPRGGIASGLAGTLYKVGAGPETAYSAPFALYEGAVSITFHSNDRNGNAEDVQSEAVFIDASAPLFAFSADQSTFALPGGFGTLSSTVIVTLLIEDPERAGTRSGLAEARFVLNGATLTLASAPGDVTASTTIALGPGLHTLAAYARDRLGHASVASVRIAVGDTLQPVTTLSVGVPKAALTGGAVLVAARTLLTLSAEDFAESGAPSGVAETRYRFAPFADFANYGTAFPAPAPDGEKLLEFNSTDRAGNIENPNKSARLVRDAAPPVLGFAFPRPDEPGLCRLSQGKVAVRGTVHDPHLKSWSLLAQGAVLVGSGTVDALSGLLGVWDATGLSGAFNLTLSASDLVDNAALATLPVQAGQPARTLALGGPSRLNKPRGVATGPNRIYVSDTNADMVRVFDAAGNALAAFGDKKVKNGLRLNKPAGLAVDGAGNIFVADANNKRVVKLSPSGVLLIEFGKNQLQRPVAVALTPGKIVVADAKAGQIVAFSEAGAMLARVNLPAALRGREDDDDEDEPRPVALSADSNGNVWVADAKGGRVLRYNAELALTQTISGFERPEGVAVSPSGACLAVSDAKQNRLRTFDAALGVELAAFGSHGAEFLLNKPAQLAFNQNGDLLVADRNNDLIQGFGLPGTPVVLAMAEPKGRGFRTSAVDDAPTLLAQRVGATEGGLLEHPDRSAVEIPPGALSEDAEISIAEAAEAGTAQRRAQFLTPASPAREFGPHGQAFTQPVTITLPYRPALLAGARPAELKLHYWNVARGFWEALDSTVDEEDATVSARVMHFSLYQVLAPARALNAALADPDASFAFRAVYVFPNPVRGGGRAVIRLQAGVADSVSVNIYDVSGERVHSGAFGPPALLDDGNGKGPQWTYDYAWDAAGVGSGVYICVVTAKKGGQAAVRKTVKLGVLK